MNEVLFARLKSSMPTNQDLCKSVTTRILQDLNSQFIKQNFSRILSEIHEEIYEEYKSKEKALSQSLFDELVRESGRIDFDELNAFFLSLTASRKARAVSAFEYMIGGLLMQLKYPFDTQVTIDGAKPDFVLPSEEFFRERPLDSLILTAKRTLRERWRQVVTEANKAYGFYLVTLDERISANQLAGASDHKVYVVTTSQIIENNQDYRSAYNVLSFEQFFSEHLDPLMSRWGH